MTWAFVLVDESLQVKLLNNFCFIQCFLLILFISDPENIQKQISPTSSSRLVVFSNIEAYEEE